MKTIIDKTTDKRAYLTPRIEKVNLDSEISLQLESSPPDDPVLTKAPDYFNNDPFKSNQA
jgi:hypothetical protein